MKKLFIFFIFFALNACGQDIYTENLKKYQYQPKSKLRDSLIINNLFALTRIVHHDLEFWIDSLQSFSINNKSETGFLLWKIIDSEKAIRQLNFEEGLKKHLDFAKQLEKSNQARYASWCYLRAGIILARPSTPYIRKKDALAFYNKGLKIAITEKDTSEIIRANVYIGEYFLDNQKIPLAIQFLKKAENMINNFPDKNLFPTTLASLGASYLLIDKPTIAANYFKKMDYWLVNNPFKFKEFYYSYIYNIKYLAFANYFFSKKDFFNAAQFSEKGYNDVQGFKKANNKRSYNTYVVDHLKILYKANRELGNYKKAIQYLEELQEILNENGKNELNQKFQELNAKYQTEQKELKIRILENEKNITKLNNQKKIVFFLVVIILSLAGFTIYIFWSRKKLQAKNAEISAALLQGQTIERKRVAADLHDNLGSTMSSLIWTMEAIDTTKFQTDEKNVYQNLKKMLSSAYDEVRLLSHNLLPEEFEKQGLTAALQYFVRKINQNSNIKFELQIEEQLGRLGNKVEFELYSICLELANNILKHSKATEAKIQLLKSEDEIKLVVEDNGIGIFENNSDGKGMKNVRARVESLNGIFSLKNNEPQGTLIEIFILV